MSDALVLLVASALSITGMGWLALAMEVHWGQVMHQHSEAASGPRRTLRWAGAGALLLSGGLCLAADRPSMAVLVWTMLLALGAIVVAMTLSWRPGWLKWLAWRVP